MRFAKKLRIFNQDSNWLWFMFLSYNVNGLFKRLLAYWWSFALSCVHFYSMGAWSTIWKFESLCTEDFWGHSVTSLSLDTTLLTSRTQYLLHFFLKSWINSFYLFDFFELSYTHFKFLFLLFSFFLTYKTLNCKLSFTRRSGCSYILHFRLCIVCLSSLNTSDPSSHPNSV